MGRLKNMLQKAAIRLLDIKPANPKTITIYERDTYETETLRNRLWYRGDPNELEQYFKKVAKEWRGSAKTKFWAAEPSKDSAIRKMHTGLPKMIANKLSDIVVADMDNIELDNKFQSLWDKMSKENKFPQLIGSCISETLVDGDGAFKISVDTDLSLYPIIEFYGGERVSYVYKRGRLQEIIFHTSYTQDMADFCLHEHYGRGFIDYKLYNARGDEVELGTVEECISLKPHNTFAGDYIMGIPVMFFKSVKYKGRGESIFTSKNDDFDALDEVVSQWIDAIRKGRVYRYIPKSMVPKDPNTGETLSPNVFDNDYMEAGTSLAEDAKEIVTLSQADINYVVYDEIVPEPPFEIVNKGAKLYQENECDSIIAIGGGSVIDASRGINIVSHCGGQIQEYIEDKTIDQRILGLIAVPTTSGTGSELSNALVVTDTKKQEKLAVLSDEAVSEYVILVPELAKSMPKGLTISTGLDVFAHAMEAYTSNLSTPVVNAICEKIMFLVFKL